MRFLTFSFIKTCRLNVLWSQPLKQISGLSSHSVEVARQNASGAGLVEVAASWPAEEAPEQRAAVLRGLRVLPAFVSEQEEAELMAELQPRLAKMRYEYDHWDNAIHGYRETDRAQWSVANAAVLRRVREAAFTEPAHGEPLAAHHVLDLAAAGHISPHIDAVRFCGPVIAGLCLLSAAVMRLQHPQHPHRALDALLERRALYIMEGEARYTFTHAVLGGEESRWRACRLPRMRRVAVIARSQPRAEDREGGDPQGYSRGNQ